MTRKAIEYKMMTARYVLAPGNASEESERWNFEGGIARCVVVNCVMPLSRGDKVKTR